jgi:predicted ATPase
LCTAQGAWTATALDLLAALIDHGLLQQSPGVDGQPRYSLFETVREYAQERLAACGELKGLGPGTPRITSR